MKVAQLQIEKLQCSLSYEQERCFTLDLELSTTRAELQKKKEQSGRLEMELQQLKVEHQEVVSGLKSAISNFFPHIYVYTCLCVCNLWYFSLHPTCNHCTFMLSVYSSCSYSMKCTYCIMQHTPENYEIPYTEIIQSFHMHDTDNSFHLPSLIRPSWQKQC